MQTLLFEMKLKCDVVVTLILHAALNLLLQPLCPLESLSDCSCWMLGRGSACCIMLAWDNYHYCMLHPAAAAAAPAGQPCPVQEGRELWNRRCFTSDRDIKPRDALPWSSCRSGFK